ncbi:hypothetical protein [Parabacteroides bouchesdurhonensis]|uniref:hypothetical protein n=1 Tax=Parabacteroides bouchesdurhonensis TaxID=1936995 RepID=UPI000E4FE57E|nr:hypothetical protein [Parabacteroides bouchesdurhonensis]RHJ94193.1 hypothetical protein DW095_04180 [Bacteroides sp. AM07-16]
MYSFFHYYWLLVTSILLFFIIGVLVRYALRLKKVFSVSAKDIFMNCFVGLNFCVALFSLICTRGITVNWFIVIIAFLYYFQTRKQSNYTSLSTNAGINTRGLLYYIIVFIFFTLSLYSFYYFFSYSAETNSFRPIEIDNYFHAQLSEYLKRGYENTYFTLNLTGDANVLSPYHYYEIWLSSLLSTIPGGITLFTYTVVVPVIGLTMILFGFLAVIEIHRKIVWYIPILLLPVVLLSDLAIILHDYFPWIYYPTRLGGIINATKQTYLAVFFMGGVLFYLEKNWRALFYSQMILLAVTTMSVPVVCGVTGSILFVYMIKNKTFLWSYTLPFVFLVFCYGLYTFICMRNGNLPMGIDREIPWYKLRMLITIPLAQILKYFPYLFLMIFLNHRVVRSFIYENKFAIVAFIVFPVLFSVVMRSVHPDADQFISCVYPAFFCVIIPSSILFLWTNKPIFTVMQKIVFSIVYVSMLVVSWATNFYIMERNVLPISLERLNYEKSVIDSVVLDRMNNVGVYSPSYVYKPSENIMSYYGAYTTYLDAVRNEIVYWQINKSDHNMFGRIPYEIELEKNENCAFEEDDFRLAFMETKNIEYFFAWNDELPSENFLKHFDIISSDPQSGEMLFKRK